MPEEKLYPTPTWLWLLISFAVPVVGIILGILYRGKEAPESRAFGKQALVAAVAGIVTCIVLYVVWLFVLGAAAR
jgi:hypothetical protein